MTKKESIGFIGFGNMATAIFEGMAENKSLPTIYACTKPEKALPEPIITTSHENLIKKSDIIILAIKPQQLKEITPYFQNLDLSKKCIISIMAGITIASIEKLNPSLTSIIRVMPNTSASIKESISLMCNKKGTKKQFLSTAITLFEGIGTTQKINEEQMNFATAMFGSGPAFIYQIMHEFIQICAEKGFSQKDSERLIKQLFLGTSKMTKKSTKSIPTLISNICSPNGTTQAGLDKFKELDIGIILAQMINAAEVRGNELSNS